MNLFSAFLVNVSIQVRKRPLNKKELAKNEEDIIEAVSNSLTVHETKLKVSVIGNTICGSPVVLFNLIMQF